MAYTRSFIQTLIELDLWDNKIGDEGIRHIATGFKNNRVIENCHLSFRCLRSISIATDTSVFVSWKESSQRHWSEKLGRCFKEESGKKYLS